MIFFKFYLWNYKFHAIVLFLNTMAMIEKFLNKGLNLQFLCLLKKEKLKTF